MIIGDAMPLAVLFPSGTPTANDSLFGESEVTFAFPTPTNPIPSDSYVLRTRSSHHPISDDTARKVRKVIQPDGWFVAELNSTVVGIVGAVDYGEFAYIGMSRVY